MADLFSSLRSLLPQEYANRGQSSTDDDLEEATKYIKNLENSIKELGDKRDLLKKSSPPPPPSSSPAHDQQQHANNASSSSNTMISTNNSVTEKDNNNYVTIHTFPRRLEIEISVKVGGEDGFPLSKVLKQVSLVHGLDVVNCISSKVDEKCKCLIHCDLLTSDQPTTDFSELHRTLASEISIICCLR